jgi:hypothetical protein
MAKRRPKDTSADADAQPLAPGMPVRLLPHDWPFLYSVLPNGDLVMNRRLNVPVRRPAKRRAEVDAEDALV